MEASSHRVSSQTTGTATSAMATGATIHHAGRAPAAGSIVVHRPCGHGAERTGNPEEGERHRRHDTDLLFDEMRDESADRPDADGHLAGGRGGARAGDPTHKECPGHEGPEPDADETAREEVIEDDVVGAIGEVLASPALAPRPQNAQVGKGEPIQSQELRLEPVAHEAPHVRRKAGNQCLASKLATPAVERPLPDLKAEPTGRPVPHVGEMAQTAEQRRRAEGCQGRGGHVQQREEERDGDEDRRDRCQRFPGTAPREEGKCGDAQAGQHPEEGAARLAQDDDDDLGREERRHDRNGKERCRAGAREDECQAAGPDDAPGDEQPPGRDPTATRGRRARWLPLPRQRS